MVNLRKSVDEAWTLEIIPGSFYHYWLLCSNENCNEMIVQLRYLLGYSEETRCFRFQDTSFDWDIEIDLPDASVHL